jgi:hypothetical protein
MILFGFQKQRALTSMMQFGLQGSTQQKGRKEENMKKMERRERNDSKMACLPSDR